MQSDSLEFSLLSIFSFLSFFTFFIVQKLSHKLFNGLLFDNDFDKPQAFHDTNIPRSGGLASIISFLIFILLNNLLFSSFNFDYLVLGLGLFLIGFLCFLFYGFPWKSEDKSRPCVHFEHLLSYCGAVLKQIQLFLDVFRKLPAKKRSFPGMFRICSGNSSGLYVRKCQEMSGCFPDFSWTFPEMSEYPLPIRSH